MSIPLLIVIVALIVFATVLNTALTVWGMLYLFKKMSSMSYLFMPAPDPATRITDIDEHFSETPVGIPPSLARD